MVLLERGPHPGLAEELHVHPVGLHGLHEAVLDLEPGDRVDEDPHPHPCPCPFPEGVRELPGRLTLPVHERHEVHAALRAADRLEHGGEDLVPVVEHLDRVALGEVDADQALEHAAQAGTVLGVLA